MNEKVLVSPTEVDYIVERHDPSQKLFGKGRLATRRIALH